MSLITHVHIPAAWGMPDTDLAVATTGWENPKVAAAKIFHKMVEAVDAEGKFKGRFKYGLPPCCTFKTDEQSVIDCRNELLAVLGKYSACERGRLL